MWSQEEALVIFDAYNERFAVCLKDFLKDCGYKTYLGNPIHVAGLKTLNWFQSFIVDIVAGLSFWSAASWC